ncbi:MAG TPA: MFS transporter [Mycobacteriales bacterium]|nr:MFS transporter [Mycobacteriales bacterium]
MPTSSWRCAWRSGRPQASSSARPPTSSCREGQLPAPEATAASKPASFPFHRRLLALELPTGDTTSHDAQPLLLTLGLPTIGLAFAITILTTYGPSSLATLKHSSTAKIGALFGGEGAFALVIPLFAGFLSDRISGGTRFGRRMPFVMVGAPLAAAGLVLLTLATNLQFAGVSILLFFVGYYLFYPPYRAIYADLLPKRLLPRAQSSQGIMRGVGTGLALVSGGFLYSIWKPLPFVLAAGMLGVATLPLRPVHRLSRRLPEPPRVERDTGNPVAELLVHNRPLQWFSVANAIWEYSFAGLKFAIVLYITTGLDRSHALASTVMTVVAVAYVIGAPLAGRLAERFGIVRVMEVSALVYGVLLCVAFFPRSIAPMLVLLPIGSIAGSILMTLPQALAFTLAPETNQGAAAGIVDFSRGTGVVLGPVLVGAVISAFSSTLSSTHGYAAMWPMIGVPILLTIPLLRMLRRAEARARSAG